MLWDAETQWNGRRDDAWIKQPTRAIRIAMIWTLIEHEVRLSRLMESLARHPDEPYGHRYGHVKCCVRCDQCGAILQIPFVEKDSLLNRGEASRDREVKAAIALHVASDHLLFNLVGLR